MPTCPQPSCSAELSVAYEDNRVWVNFAAFASVVIAVRLAGKTAVSKGLKIRDRCRFVRHVLL